MKTKQLIQTLFLSCLFTLSGILTAAASSCQAGFTWTQTAPNTLAFTNTSTGTNSNTFYTWNFGDGNYAYGANNGNHVYNVPGSYTACLTINDSLSTGCTSTWCQAVTVTGTVICNLADNMSMVSPSCPTCSDGSASANPSGGTAPYTYSWFNPASSAQTVTGLVTGSYKVSITDANGCSLIDSIAVTASCQANFTWTQTSPNVLTLTNTSTGTTSGTFYYWNFGDSNYAYGQNNGTHTYAVPGTYTACLNITDSIHGCNSTYCQVVTVTGTVLCTLTDNMGSTYASCNTCADGTATANPSGGTAPYTYSWFSPASSAQTIYGLNPGTYHVQITDANGCTVIDSATVYMVSSSCQASFTWTQSSPNNISFTSTSTGVSGTTHYIWSYGDSSPGTYGQYPAPHTYSIPGTYTVCLYISDSLNGCASNFCDTVHVTGTVICTLSATLGANNATCTTCADGSAYTASVSGGTAPYAYSWSNGATTSGIYGVTPGFYTLCITDANSCHTCDTITIGVSPAGPCHAYFTLTPDTTYPGNYWATNLSSGGPHTTYTWTWGDSSPNDTTLTPSHTYPGPGLYTICLTIHDSTGCTSTYCDTLTAVRLPSWVASHHTTVNVRNHTSPLGISEHQALNNWNVFPNPSNGITTVAYTLSQNSNVTIGIYNLVGQEVVMVENTSTKPAGNYQLTVDAAALKPGIYMVRIMANDKSETRRLSVVR